MMETSLRCGEASSLVLPVPIEKNPFKNGSPELPQVGLSTFSLLATMLDTDRKGYLERAISNAQKDARKSDMALHTEAASSFSQLIRSQVVSPQDFTTMFLPSIFHYINQGDQGIYNIWINLLMELVSLLPKDSVRNDIYQLAVTQSQMTSPLYQRMGAAKLFGRMCSRFDQLLVIKDVLPMIHSLSQDVSSKVRACVCQQLHLLAKELPPDVIKTSIIPILIELVRDEDETVRAEAVDLLTLIIPILPDSTLRSTVVPLVLSICDRSLLTVDNAVIRLSSNFSSICHGLSDVVTSSEKTRFVKAFCELAGLGKTVIDPRISKSQVIEDGNEDTRIKNTECRRHSAENLPSMIKFGKTDHITRKLLRVLTDMSSDPSSSVRRTIAANLHEVTALGGESLIFGKSVFMDLLRDINIEVLHSLAANISVIVNHLNVGGTFQSDKDPGRIELAKAICCCAETAQSSLNWRLFEEMCRQMECLVRLVPSGYVFANLVPRMFDVVMKARVRPVRIAAGRTLLIYLRYNLKAEHRQKIRTQLRQDLGRSDSCHRRMLYLKLCEAAMDIFSAEYFRSHFLLPLLNLSSDKVANNRIVFASLLPRLFQITCADEMLSIELVRVVSAMTGSETDADVKEALTVAANWTDTKERITSHTKEDARKLEEERRLASIVTNSIALKSGTEDCWLVRKGSSGFKSRLARPSTVNTQTNRPLPLSIKSRCEHTNPACTCFGVARRLGKPDTEVPWLNLEANQRNDFRMLARKNCCCPNLTSSSVSIFSSAFERDFYRDTGVRVLDIVGTTPQPRPPMLLAKTGRSKSFILPSSRVSDTVPQSRLVTRIPVSGGKYPANRRSMDISQLSRGIKARTLIDGRGESSQQLNSRLPVRTGRLGM